jgi:hypothetical protein
MAGPNWFTGSFGTTNPFQVSSSPFFRNTPFQGFQGGFGPGNSPFQNQPFGISPNTTQIQNTISEIVRQTIPTILASYGFQPTSGFQTSFGFQTPIGFSSPTSSFQFGSPFSSMPNNYNWQNPSFFTEIIRQATNQAIQNIAQQNPTLFSTGSMGWNQPFTGMGTGFNWTSNTFGINPQQQNLWNFIGQICQQACQQACQTIIQAVTTTASQCINQISQNTQINQSQNTPFNIATPFGINPQLQQNLWNLTGQICQQACQQACQTIIQAVTTTANECINQINQTQSGSFNTQNTPFSTQSTAFSSQNTPFSTSNTPFFYNNTTPQFGFTPGIPTGAGAF